MVDMLNSEENKNKNNDPDGLGIRIGETLVDSEIIEADKRKLEEQQSRKREKKLAKKRKARRIVVIVILVIAVIAGVTAAIVYSNIKKAQEDTAVAVEVGTGEEIKYAQITSMVGNDMEIIYVDETAGDSAGDSQNSESAIPNNGDMSEMGDMSDKTDMSDKPDMGDMPDVNDKSDMTNMGIPGDMDNMPGGDSGKTPNESTYQTFSLEIPVGTDVYTKLGTITTFSRLVAGDTVAIIFEAGTENILRIYMQ